MLRLLPLLLLVAGALPAVASDCQPPGGGGAVMKPIGDARFRAVLKTDPAIIKVGVPFVATLALCSDTGAAVERLAIDATMPAHRHGMNYKPEIAAKGDGLFEGRGFLFHMPGAWEFAVTVHSGGQPSRLKLDVDVK